MFILVIMSGELNDLNLDSNKPYTVTSLHAGVDYRNNFATTHADYPELKVSNNGTV